MTCFSFLSLERISSSSAMCSRMDFSSLRISSTESCVRRWSCSSRMASTWIGVRPRVALRPAVSPSMPPSLYLRPSSLTPSSFLDLPFSVMVTSCSVKYLSRFSLASARLAEELDERNEAELTRLTADDGQQDHAEGFLHLRVLEKIVKDELRFFAALDFDDDAHAFAGGFVAHVGDAVDFFALHQLGDALDELGFVNLVRNFRDDDIFAVFADFLDGGFRAHHEAAAAGLVRRFNAFAAGDVGAGGKIRAGHQLHDFF